MDWQAFGLASLFLVIGTGIRAIYPYLVAGFTALTEGQPWPDWDWKYVGSFGLWVLGYLGVLLVSDVARSALIEMGAWAALAIGYTGGDIVREAVKLFIPRLR
jgi:hypothetical protein